MYFTINIDFMPKKRYIINEAVCIAGVLYVKIVTYNLD